MKKVAYNACFGGFGLSPLAETQYMAKKGVQLFWYKELGHENLVRIDDVNSIGAGWMGPNASKKDLGPTVTKIPNEHFHYKSYSPYDDDGTREDPDLIEVIERLGEKANGACASLSIAEIPDNAEYEITEYDGNEDVVPPRQTW